MEKRINPRHDCILERKKTTTKTSVENGCIHFQPHFKFLPQQSMAHFLEILDNFQIKTTEQRKCSAHINLLVTLVMHRLCYSFSSLFAAQQKQKNLSGLGFGIVRDSEGDHRLMS